MGIYKRKDGEGNHVGPWIIQYPHRVDPITGKTIWTSCKVHGSKTLAKQILQEKLVEWDKARHLKIEVKKKYTFGELLTWYLDHPKAKRKKTYSRDVEMSRVLWEKFGSRPADEIKATDIERFQDLMLATKSKRGKPYMPATVNRFVTVIKRVYNLAIRDEMVERNPCFKVPFLPERNARNRIVTPEEFETLKEELPEYSLILSIGYYLGMREGEILRLRERQIHFFESGIDEGYIELYDGETKSGEGREVPFSGTIGMLLKGHLATRKKRGPSQLVFATEKGNLIGNFRRAFQRACKRSGITKLCFHDFRHTAITNMRKAGVSISVIMAISGHKTLVMFRRYNRIDLGDGREAMRQLDQFLSGEQSKKEPKKDAEDERNRDSDYFIITSGLQNGKPALA